jgi:O-antigen/teichoic acid export membrane protein
LKTQEKSVFKNTIMFSSVKVIQILIGVLRNKAIAVFLGSEGVGAIGIFNNTVNLIRTGAGLGVSQSAVRDISEARGSNSQPVIQDIVSITKTIVKYTAVLGMVVAIIIAFPLSEYSFGTKSYGPSFLLLAIVVGVVILTEGNYAILKGMRALRYLAYSGIIGAVVGLIVSVPMYYYFGKSGIVPSLIIAGISNLLVSNFYLKKLNIDSVRFSLQVILKKASPFILMGMALMFVDFMSLLFDLVIAAYVRSEGGLATVGQYRAGVTIIVSYFGIVLTSMATDYYPRISAVHQDNDLVQSELNLQTDIGLTILFPVAILFIILSPQLLVILYSREFTESVNFTDYAIYGTVLVIYSNNIGMILLAKQSAKIFTLYSLIHRLIFIPIYIILFNRYGLSGLGLSYTINIVAQFIGLSILTNYLYGIRLSYHLITKLIMIVITIAICYYSRLEIETIWLKYSIFALMICLSSVYSLKHFQKVFGKK